MSLRTSVPSSPKYLVKLSGVKWVIPFMAHSLVPTSILVIRVMLGISSVANKFCFALHQALNELPM